MNNIDILPPAQFGETYKRLDNFSSPHSNFNDQTIKESTFVLYNNLFKQIQTQRTEPPCPQPSLFTTVCQISFVKCLCKH